VWIFGGVVYFTAPNQDVYLNDLWEFNPSTMQWTWMGGSGAPLSNCAVILGNTACGQSGVYGTLGTPAAGNMPGGRWEASAWSDGNGHLWLYGGDGFDSKGQLGVLNDLWEFDLASKEWTWMGGSSTVPGSGYGDAGVYGTLGTPAAGNNPGSLFFASTAIDSNGNAWLFGGWGEDVYGADGLPNNLWEFDRANHEWAWMSGNETFSTVYYEPTVYGSLGTPAAGNTPGSRWEGATWVDNSGHVWNFGGGGYNNNGNSGLLNELWEFDPNKMEWAWVGGDQTMNCAAYGTQNCGNSGVYGALGLEGSGNIPGGRASTAYWTDNTGDFWLFGGVGFDSNGTRGYLNDLWEFDPTAVQWRWMGGNTTGHGEATTYGALGTSAAGNIPGSRQEAASWTDAKGNFWLFGGDGSDASGNVSELNDLWVYQPSNTLNLPHADFSLAATPASSTVAAGQYGTTSISVTPTNGFSSTVSFTCSGLPYGATCIFSPQTVTPSAGVASTTLNITTNVSMAAIRHPAGPLFPFSALAALVCCIGWKRRRLSQLAVLIAVSVIGFSLLTGCGGGNSGGVSSAPQSATYIITVNASSGSLVHSTPFSLTVN
jgi:N-acetylneuraminic acid mutarotase